MAKKNLIVLLSATLTACGLIVLVVPAGATVYSGDKCGKVYSDFDLKWYVDSNGSRACIDQGLFAQVFFHMTPLAFDYLRNGHSALNDWTVLQLQGSKWRGYTRGTCIVSSGVRYSNVCGEVTIRRLPATARAPAASRVRIQIRSCNYESPTAVRLDCSDYITKLDRAW